VRDPSELRKVLAKDAYDAMFCGWSYHQGTWQDALKEVLQQCPELPVIVFCRAGGEREWLEALEAGAFDLLVAPYVKRNVYPLLEHAIASSEARRLHSTDSYQRARVS
ncbi:MAG: hypothetical protein HY648_00820, partial [Acidobacteria bacterium]|nr:hypothetical protein [Acidobacteriota bacterium]